MPKEKKIFEKLANQIPPPTLHVACSMFKLTRSGHILPSPTQLGNLCVDEHDCTFHQHNQLPEKITEDFKTGAISSLSRRAIFAEIKIVSKIASYRPLGLHLATRSQW